MLLSFPIQTTFITFWLMSLPLFSVPSLFITPQPERNSWNANPVKTLPWLPIKIKIKIQNSHHNSTWLLVLFLLQLTSFLTFVLLQPHCSAFKSSNTSNSSHFGEFRTELLFKALCLSNSYFPFQSQPCHYLKETFPNHHHPQSNLNLSIIPSYILPS